MDYDTNCLVANISNIMPLFTSCMSQNLLCITMQVEEEEYIDTTMLDICNNVASGQEITSMMSDRLAACICYVVSMHFGYGRILHRPQWDICVSALSEYVMENIGGSITKNHLLLEIGKLNVR